ncbi:beta-ketoacyl synthase N-terminal-like domain-containing protein [Nocardia thailandica]
MRDAGRGGVARPDSMPIVGVGAVTAYGWGREPLWDGLLGGVPAPRRHPGYGPGRDEYAWVGPIPPDPAGGGSAARFGRAVRAAAAEAMADASARGWSGAGRTVGIVHAITLGDVADWRDYARGGLRRSRDYLPLLPSTVISDLAVEYGFHGPAVNVSAACSSAGAGLLTGLLWQRAGLVDDVLCVVTDLSATPEMLAQFVALGVAVADADPLTACRPFQHGTRGFTMAEASVALLLSGAADRPYARVLGGSMNNDGYHAVSMNPSGRYLTACVEAALADAGVEPGGIGWFNAHGTGTRQCDRAERALLSGVFADRPAVYALKPLTGHCQGAAAGVEIATTALAYDRGVLPAPRPVAPAYDRLVDGPVGQDGAPTLKLSMGMGGTNVALVLGPA